MSSSSSANGNPAWEKRAEVFGRAARAAREQRAAAGAEVAMLLGHDQKNLDDFPDDDAEDLGDFPDHDEDEEDDDFFVSDAEVEVEEKEERRAAMLLLKKAAFERRTPSLKVCAPKRRKVCAPLRTTKRRTPATSSSSSSAPEVTPKRQKKGMSTAPVAKYNKAGVLTIGHLHLRRANRLIEAADLANKFRCEFGHVISPEVRGRLETEGYTVVGIVGGDVIIW